MPHSSHVGDWHWLLPRRQWCQYAVYVPVPISHLVPVCHPVPGIPSGQSLGGCRPRLGRDSFWDSPQPQSWPIQLQGTYIQLLWQLPFQKHEIKILNQNLVVGKHPYLHPSQPELPDPSKCRRLNRAARILWRRNRLGLRNHHYARYNSLWILPSWLWPIACRRAREFGMARRACQHGVERSFASRRQRG